MTAWFFSFLNTLYIYFYRREEKKTIFIFTLNQIFLTKPLLIWYQPLLSQLKTFKFKCEISPKKIFISHASSCLYIYIGIYRYYLQVCTSIFSIAICLHKLTARATITPHYFHIFHFCTPKSGQKYSLPNKRTFNHEPLTINNYLIISKISPLLSKTFNTSFLINLSLPDAKKNDVLYQTVQ